MVDVLFLGVDWVQLNAGTHFTVERSFGLFFAWNNNLGLNVCHHFIRGAKVARFEAQTSPPRPLSPEKQSELLGTI